MVAPFISLLFVSFIFFSVAGTFPQTKDDSSARGTLSATPSDSLKIAVEDTKAKHGSASPSTATKENIAFVPKYPHHEDHRQSKRSLLDTLKIVLANSQAISTSGAEDGAVSSASVAAGSAVQVSNQIKDKSDPPKKLHGEDQDQHVESEHSTPHTEENVHLKFPAPITSPATKEEPIEEQASKDFPVDQTKSQRKHRSYHLRSL